MSTLTGTVRDAAGDPLLVDGKIWFEISQNANVISGGGCGGPYAISPGIPNVFTLLNGAIQGSPTIPGQSCISPSNTYYKMSVVTDDGVLVLRRNVVVDGASVDIGALTAPVLPGQTGIPGPQGPPMGLYGEGSPLPNKGALNFLLPLEAPDDAINPWNNVQIDVTPAHDGGAVAKQAATPGTVQTGNINISGRVIAGGGLLKGAQIISYDGTEPAATAAYSPSTFSKIGLYDTVNGWSELDFITKGVFGSYAGGGIGFFHTNGNDTPIPTYTIFAEVNDTTDPSTRAMWIWDKQRAAGIVKIDPAGRVTIGEAGSFIGNSSAIFDVQSTARGMLMPKMTTTQRNAIASPVPGLQLFDTVPQHPNYYDGVRFRATGRYGTRPEDYGGIADGKIVDDASITSGSANLTTVGGGFSGSDAGKTIWVFRAGAAGATLKTTIQSVETASSITLAANAGTTVVQTKTVWGTDNTTAVSNALSEGGALIFSEGLYIVDGTLSLSSQNFSLRGQGNGRTILFNAKTNGNHLSFGFAGANMTISDMSLYGPGLPMTSGAAIAFPNGTYFSCTLQNIEIRDVWDGLSVATTGGPNLQQVDFFGVNNTGINFSGGSLIYYRGLIYNFPTITGGTLAITSGTPNLTSTVAAFTTKDIGKRIAVVGAGAAGATLVTTITAVASTTACTLAANAGTTVSGKVGALTPPSIAGIAMYNGTPYVNTVDIVGHDVSVLIAPGASQIVNYGFWHNLLCDSAHDVGLHIAPTTAATGAVVSHNFVNCWFASAGASAQLDGGTNQQGVRIVAAAAAGNITGIRFSGGCRFVNSVKGGLFADGGGAGRITNLTIDGCEFDGNASTSNTYDEISLANVTDLSVTDNHISHTFFSAGVTDRYGINIASSCAGTIRYSGNIIINAATADILDSSAATTKVMSNPKQASITLANGLNSNVNSLANDFLYIVGPTGAFSLGGLTKGCDGRVVRVLNTLNQTMTIVNEDASSSAANRITTLTGGNVVLRANLPSMATLIYRADAFRWVLVSTN